jgi:hypothetical protein
MRKLFLLAAVMIGTQIYGAVAQQPSAPNVSITPERRGSCFEILELEKIRVDPQTKTMLVYPSDQQLYLDYIAVQSWLQGFISAAGGLVASDSKIDPKQTMIQWRTWLFSYCRTYPNKTLVDAARQLSEALKAR